MTLRGSVNDAVFVFLIREGVFSDAMFAGTFTPRNRERAALWHAGEVGLAAEEIGVGLHQGLIGAALDAVEEGFGARVLLPYTAGVSETTIRPALERMREAGVELVIDLPGDTDITEVTGSGVADRR